MGGINRQKCELGATVVGSVLSVYSGGMGRWLRFPLHVFGLYRPKGLKKIWWNELLWGPPRESTSTPGVDDPARVD